MKTSSCFFCFERLAALSGWWLCVTSLLATTAEGLAIKRAVYADAACTELLEHVSYGFGDPVANPDGSKTLGPFNECTQVSGAGHSSFGSIAVCDAATGNTGRKSYHDMDCTAVMEEAVSLVPPTTCTKSLDCAESLVATCWTTTECSAREPSDISPNVYNFLVDAYHDAQCMDPTGDAEIVSAELFMSSALRGDGSCRRVKEGSGFGLSECLADGSLVWQTFGSDDDVCTDEVFDERVFWSAEASSACRAVKINGLYYNRVSCTTHPVTLIPRPRKEFRRSSSDGPRNSYLKGSRTGYRKRSRKDRTGK